LTSTAKVRGSDFKISLGDLGRRKPVVEAERRFGYISHSSNHKAVTAGSFRKVKWSLEDGAVLA
jgi:hypothetical protein